MSELLFNITVYAVALIVVLAVCIAWLISIYFNELDSLEARRFERTQEEAVK